MASAFTLNDFFSALEEGCYKVVLEDEFEVVFSGHLPQITRITAPQTHYNRTLLVRHYSSDKLEPDAWNCETSTGLPIRIPYDTIRFFRKED